MQMLKTKLLNFLSDEDGATSIEYTLIGAIVSIAIVATLTKISVSLQGDFNKVNSSFGP
jgi:pilus assembly protein Flp/PilA